LIALVGCYYYPIFMIDPKIWQPHACGFYFYTDPKIMAKIVGSFRCMRANYEQHKSRNCLSNVHAVN
jgi:hypothetical protein